MPWQVEEGVRKALAAAAEAGIARDALLAREGALEAQLIGLRHRLTSLDSELLAGTEARVAVASLQAVLTASTNEAATLRGQVRATTEHAIIVFWQLFVGIAVNVSFRLVMQWSGCRRFICLLACCGLCSAISSLAMLLSDRGCVLVQLTEVRASSERLARERASAQVELAGLREQLEGQGLSLRRSAPALGCMQAVEAVRDAELGREQAEARERSAQMNADRMRRQWDLARQQLEA